jgi:RHS repeat-associated protein
VYDADTGLTDMQARLYDPLIGRFLSTDPVEFNSSSPFTFNRYAYANNNPYRYTDPSGAETEEIVVEATPPVSRSVWEKLKEKLNPFVKPIEAAKDEKHEEPPANNAEAALKKLKEAAKDKAKEGIKSALKEAARKAGASEAQICEVEKCGTAGPNMSVCLMTYCGEELGLGGNDPVDEKH